MANNLGHFADCGIGTSCGLDHVKEYSGTGQMAQVALQGRMKWKLQNFIQEILTQPKQNTGVYRLNVESDLRSFGNLPS